MQFNTTRGIHPVPIEIRAEATPDRFGIEIGGLPEAAARETKVRVECALNMAGIRGSAKVLVHEPNGVKWAPDAALDLPIALEVARALGAVTLPDDLDAYGELALNGRLRPVRGLCCRLQRGRRALIPRDNAAEAAAVVEPGDEPVACLWFDEVIGWLQHGTGGQIVAPQRIEPPPSESVDFMVGQSAAFERVVATIRHGLPRALLVAPPGVGLTLMARELACELGPLTAEEARDVTRVHSVAGLVDRGPVTRRPFRAPHHTVSVAGLCGGGDKPRPGEVSLAHRGVLLLDDVTEFSERALRVLAHDLNNAEALLDRGSFPAHPAAVIATARPCSCGYRGSKRRACACSPQAIERYEARLDRIHQLLELKRIDLGDGADLRVAASTNACGWQTAYGLPHARFCAQPRAPGKPHCAEHMADLAELYGSES